MLKKVAFAGVGMVMLGTPLILSAQVTPLIDTCANNATATCLENAIQQLTEFLNSLGESSSTSQPSATTQSSSAASPQSSVASGPDGALEASEAPVQYTIVAGGTTDVTMDSFTLHPIDESLNLQTVGLYMVAQQASPGDVVRATVWQGVTQIGQVIFTPTSYSSNCPNFIAGSPAENCYYATTTVPAAISLPIGTDTNFTIKADIANLGAGQPGTSGDDVAIGFAHATAVGVTSGELYQSSQAQAGFAAPAGIRIFRSYPTVTQLPDNDTLTNSAGKGVALLRFSVTASPSGSISIGRIIWDLAASGVEFSGMNSYGYTDPGFSQPIPGTSQGNLGSTNPVMSLGDSSYDIPFLNVLQPIVVPAGQTYYFEIIGNVSALSGNASVTANLNGDPTYAPIGSYSGIIASFGNSANFLWSPDDTGNSQFSTNDWTDGYDIVGLPSHVISQTITGTTATSGSSGSAPTATLTVGGATKLTGVSVATPMTIVWSSTNGTSAQGTYTVDSPACGQSGTGPFPWGDGNTLSGSDNASIGACQAGHTYTFKYTVTGPNGVATALAIVQVRNSAPPTATLTANGSTNITANVGDRIQFQWLANLASSAQGTYTVDSPACGQSGTGPFPWGDGNTLDGGDYLGATIVPCQAGHTYTLIYTVTSANGQTASSSVILHVVSTNPAPTATLTVNGSANITAGVGTPVSFAWSSTNGVSAKGTYTTDSPACGQSGTGPYPWGDGNTLSGSDNNDTSISACQVGHTYTLNYTVTAADGQEATASVNVQVTANSASSAPSDASRLQNLQTLQSQIEAYKGQHGSYPTTNGAWVCSNPSGCPLGVPNWTSTLSVLNVSLPANISMAQCQWDANETQSYMYVSNGSWYKLIVCTQNPVASSDPDYDPTRSNSSGSIDYAVCGGTLPSGQTCGTVALSNTSSYANLASVLTSVLAILGELKGM